ncbi:MAG: VanW family protein [Nannocystaceae bacterium]
MAALALLALDYQEVQADTRVLPGIHLAGADVGGLDEAALRAQAAAAAERGLSRPLELRAGDARTTTTAAGLGALPSPELAITRALAFGRSGDPIADLRARAAAARGEIDLAIGYRFEAERALEQLLTLAPAVERPSLPTRFDFDSHEVLPPTPGSVLLAHDSLSAVAVGLAAGRTAIDLVVAPQPPAEDPLAAVAGSLDIHEVLGTFSTPYSSDPSYSDRTHNLKLGATALDGYVLAPGETMSFNAVVGERSDQAGFRYAPGITAGELVDVVGGGTCQISSTLYGAAFFAGLDLVEARPHSRPSAYVDMGLDSTVVDGMIDMKLRNGYDFPVVLHTAVHGGKVTIEVLGPKRPYKVAFERELKEVLPYTTTVRSDANLRSGATAVAQQGKRGFRVTRRRIFYTGEEVAKTEEWELYYPPTTEILRRGTSPNGALPSGSSPSKLRDPAPSLRIVQ